MTNINKNMINETLIKVHATLKYVILFTTMYLATLLIGLFVINEITDYNFLSQIQWLVLSFLFVFICIIMFILMYATTLIEEKLEKNDIL